MAKPRIRRIPLIFSIVGAIGLLIWRAFVSGQPLPAERGSLGQAIYEMRCAPCHGTDGKGDGPYAMMLSPRPRDFTQGLFEYRTTESGTPPTDDDLKRTISKGLPGTAMPAWGDFIKGDSLDAVVEYLKRFSDRFETEQPVPVQVGPEPRATPASIAAGREVYEKLQCASCHGTDGRGTDAVATGFQNAAGHEIRTPDLTAPWNFRGGSTARDIYMRFRTGLDGSPMPSFVGAATDREMWLLAQYVVSIGREPAWEMDEQELRAFFSSQVDRAKQDPVQWGKYLVDGIGCVDCHTPVDSRGGHVESLRLAGGQRWTFGPYGDFITSNLTSDTATGLGGWTDEEFRQAVTRGVRRDGTRMLPFPMPWTSYANLTADDLSAILAYLRTVPPIHNEIPKPEGRGFFSYMWGKFKLLVLREDIPAEVSPGNAGSFREAGQ